MTTHDIYASRHPLPPVPTPGPRSTLRWGIVARALPRQVRGVPVVAGEGGVYRGPLIRVRVWKDRYGKIVGHRVQRQQVTEHEVIVVREELVRNLESYQGWTRNAIGGLGAMVSYPDVEALAQAVRRVA